MSKKYKYYICEMSLLIKVLKKLGGTEGVTILADYLYWC